MWGGGNHASPGLTDDFIGGESIILIFLSLFLFPRGVDENGKLRSPSPSPLRRPPKITTLNLSVYGNRPDNSGLN